MTDYRSWDRFDVEKAEEELDVRLAHEDYYFSFTAEVVKSTKDALTDADGVLKKAVESLRSKLAVSSLAGKGSMRNRNRQERSSSSSIGGKGNNQVPILSTNPRLSEMIAVLEMIIHNLSSLQLIYKDLPVGVSLPPNARKVIKTCTSLYNEALRVNELGTIATAIVDTASNTMSKPFISITENDESQCCDNPNCRAQKPILMTAKTDIKTAKNAVAVAEKKLAEAMKSGFDQMSIGMLQKDVDYYRELILGLQQNDRAVEGTDLIDLPDTDQLYCGTCIGPASPSTSVVVTAPEIVKESITVSNSNTLITDTSSYMSWTNGITLTLTAVSEPVTHVLRQTSHVLARSSLSSGDFAGAAEISRFHLKLIETCKVTENNNSTKSTDNNNPGNGVNRVKHPLHVTEQEEAHVWMTRAVAFAGIGSAYLTNIHCRMAGKICPKYPDIEVMTTCLDAQELSHATKIRQISLGQALASEVIRLTAFVASSSSSTESKVDVACGITPAQIVYLLTAEKNANADSPQDHVNASAHVGNTDLHMDEEESGEDEGGGMDERIATAVTADVSLSADEAMTQLMQALPQPSLLLMARKLFYEGQIMYLELLRYSSEIKFLLAYVLAQRAWASIDDVAVGTDGVEGTYLRGICSAALINASVCRVHRSTSSSTTTSSSSSSSSTVPFLSLSDLLNMDAITLCNAGIQLIDINTTQGAGLSSTGSLLAAKFRRLFLFEKLQLYGEALQELDGLEQVARGGIQAWNESNIESKTEPKKLIEGKSSPHEEGNEGKPSNLDDEMVPLFVTNASDHVQFTQKYILGVPLPWSNIKEQYSTVPSTLAATSTASSSIDPPMTSLLSQQTLDYVRDKRSRLIYLKKRFGMV